MTEAVDLSDPTSAARVILSQMGELQRKLDGLGITQEVARKKVVAPDGGPPSDGARFLKSRTLETKLVKRVVNGETVTTTIRASDFNPTVHEAVDETITDRRPAAGRAPRKPRTPAPVGVVEDERKAKLSGKSRAQLARMTLATLLAQPEVEFLDEPEDGDKDALIEQILEVDPDGEDEE